MISIHSQAQVSRNMISTAPTLKTSLSIAEFTCAAFDLYPTLPLPKMPITHTLSSTKLKRKDLSNSTLENTRKYEIFHDRHQQTFKENWSSTNIWCMFHNKASLPFSTINQMLKILGSCFLQLLFRHLVFCLARLKLVLSFCPVFRLHGKNKMAVCLRNSRYWLLYLVRKL